MGRPAGGRQAGRGGSSGGKKRPHAATAARPGEVRRLSVRERASARGLVLGHAAARDAVSRPDLHSLLALQLRVGVGRRHAGRGRGASLSPTPTGAA